ncbi:hypothetical protein Aph02nite_54810 [Actinoplanes philippinensis]|uniref:Uncharacterized protein n=1 Tax=Actinoplanes philippinensis TaxID=35752 RepID=A0A1I2J677_9ACTN|nr:hypothetical protein [Actinoplanes philippinensis]GIE79531.1 hypothetical protein Aph02nite_54810 [Actinoplanes philippinensis]SFF49520.1 hypothetical protein SAMN05421541_111319 [Actinoplanes philippinensis]
MLTHLQRPLTRRYRAEMFGHDLDALSMPGGGEGGQPHRRLLIGHNTIFAIAMLLSAVLVGLATVALH